MEECGNSSVGRALASQAGGREFEPRLPLDTKSTDNQSLTLILNVGLIHYLAHIVYMKMAY